MNHPNGKTSDEKTREREFPQEADFLHEPCWNIFGTYAVPGATDEAGRLQHGFIPTRYELGILARHYLTEIYHVRYEWEVGSPTVGLRPLKAS